jgi:hypothetical protein
MTTQTTQTTAAQLGLNVVQTLALASNPAFPRSVGNDTQGFPQFDTAAISTFATTWAAVKSHGWRLNMATYSVAPLAIMAVTQVGPSYRAAGTDPLFDDFP